MLFIFLFLNIFATSLINCMDQKEKVKQPPEMIKKSFLYTYNSTNCLCNGVGEAYYFITLPKNLTYKDLETRVKASLVKQGLSVSNIKITFKNKSFKYTYFEQHEMIDLACYEYMYINDE